MPFSISQGLNSASGGAHGATGASGYSGVSGYSGEGSSGYSGAKLAEVRTPANVSPAAASTGQNTTLALTGSTYYNLYGIAKSAGQWQVSTTSTFASTVVDTGDVAGTGTTYAVSSGLSAPATYYWRTRYKDAENIYSDWSSGTSFVTVPPPAYDFTISPSYAGASTWNLTLGGPLNIGTSGEYTIVPSKNLTVTVKMWGAGGGPGGAYGSSYPPSTQIGPGGGGGYTTGLISLAGGATYKLYIGQGGRRSPQGLTRGTGATYLSGGANQNQAWSTEGGGFSGLFNNASLNQAYAMLIAGGGGSGSDLSYSGGLGGGAGGGTSGGAGGDGNGQCGLGGTSSGGGAPSGFNGATSGSALTGGVSSTHSAPGTLGGGGGGYYGGGGGNGGGGGGGSGYAPGGTTTAGSGATPGNSGDAVRAGAGAGGTGSTNGSDGRVYISA